MARFLGELRTAYETPLPVSESSFERALGTVLRARKPAPGTVAWNLASMALLGGITCTLVLAVSGGLSPHPLTAVLVVASGAAAAVFEYRAGSADSEKQVGVV